MVWMFPPRRCEISLIRWSLIWHHLVLDLTTFLVFFLWNFNLFTSFWANCTSSCDDVEVQSIWRRPWTSTNLMHFLSSLWRTYLVFFWHYFCTNLLYFLVLEKKDFMHQHDFQILCLRKRNALAFHLAPHCEGMLNLSWQEIRWWFDVTSSPWMRYSLLWIFGVTACIEYV